MLKKIGKYIAGKITGQVTGRIIKWGFWTTLCLIGPAPIISTIGISGLAVTAVATHSGIFEYVANKTVDKLIEDK